MKLDRFSYPLAYERHENDEICCENCGEPCIDVAVTLSGDMYCSYKCLHDDLGVNHCYV